MIAARLTAVVAIGALCAATAAAAQTCHASGSATVLTVVASGEAANRQGPSKLDQFLAHQEQAFPAARTYTLDGLAALPSAQVAMILPYDGQRHVFSGPRLETILAAAGAAGHGVTAQGIDGYHMEVSAADIASRHPVLAICRDGAPLGIGDLGPGFIVFTPRAGDRPDDEEFAHMVWGVYFLRPL